MSKYITKEFELKQAMATLRKERRQSLSELKQQAYITAEYLKPSNMISRTLEDFKGKSEFKSSFITTVTSYIGGYISKRLLLGKSPSIMKKMLGLGLQIVTTKLIANKIK